jgi:hypothetical protein
MNGVSAGIRNSGDPVITQCSRVKHGVDLTQAADALQAFRQVVIGREGFDFSGVQFPGETGIFRPQTVNVPSSGEEGVGEVSAEAAG